MNKHLFTPYQFKNGTIAKNRVVVPPMASQTADEAGFVTEQTIQHYEHLVQSGAGLIFVEYSFIHPSGKGEANQLGIDEDAKIDGLKKIASTIHQTSAVAAIQLVHVGAKKNLELTNAPLMGASAVSVPVKGMQLPTPNPMTEQHIQQWIDDFVSAAKRAVTAGFDIVELHAAHGYGLNQWLSPLTNKRTDTYGGSLEGRSKLLLQIAKKIKDAFPQTLLAVRLPAQDHLAGGLTINEMRWVVSQLENVGVDLIDVSSGIGGWKRPEGRVGQGYLVSDAGQLKQSTSLPIIGVGGIETSAYIDEIIQRKQVDFAAVGRAILRDPRAWGQNNLCRCHQHHKPNPANN